MQNLEKSQDLIISRLQKLADISNTKQNVPQKVQRKILGKPKFIFKNNLFNIGFYDAGIVISDFSNIE